MNLLRELFDNSENTPKLDEMVREIGKDANIDTSDWYGKYLALGVILRNMDTKEADDFMDDTFSVMEDEVKNAYEATMMQEVA